MKRAAALLLLIASPAAAQDAYPTNYRQIIQDALPSVLKDPMSAQVQELRGPRWGHFRAIGAKSVDAWMVCYSINAKNSYGAYAGATTYMFMVAFGAVQGYRESPYLSRYAYRLVTDRNVEAECAQPADPAPAE